MIAGFLNHQQYFTLPEGLIIYFFFLASLMWYNHKANKGWFLCTPPETQTQKNPIHTMTFCTICIIHPDICMNLALIPKFHKKRCQLSPKKTARWRKKSSQVLAVSAQKFPHQRRGHEQINYPFWGESNLIQINGHFEAFPEIHFSASRLRMNNIQNHGNIRVPPHNVKDPTETRPYWWISPWNFAL